MSVELSRSDHINFEQLLTNKMLGKVNKNLIDFPFSVGVILLLTISFNFVIGVPLTFFGVQITPWHFPMSFLLAACSAWFFSDSKVLLKSVPTAAVIIILSLWVASRTYDPNFDAYWYHYEMVDFFVEGTWNSYPYPADNQGVNDFAKHYPHGVEFCEACIYKLTGELPTIKAFFLILFSAAGFYVWEASGRLPFSMSNRQRGLLVFITLCNPIGIAQAPTASVDYVMYYTIVITIASTIGIYRKKAVFVNYASIVCVTILAFNTKSLAAVTQTIAFLAIFAGWFIYGDKTELKRYVSITFTTGVLAIIIWGFHSYISNWIYFGNPIYPHGEENYIEAVNSGPMIFRDLNRFARFFVSIFSSSEEDFTQMAQQRVGGFGLLFGVIFLLSVVILIYHCVAKRKFDILSFAYIISVASCFVFPLTWWARFICQLWLIVPCSYLMICSAATKPREIVAWGFSILILLNSLIVFRVNYRECLYETVRRDAVYKVLSGKTVRIANLSKHAERELEKHNILPVVVPANEIPKDEDVIAIPNYQWIWEFNVMDVDPLTRKEIDMHTDSIMNLSAIERFTYLIKRQNSDN